MSRVGKKIIECPDGVEVAVNEGIVTVKGPKGTLQIAMDPVVALNKEEKIVRLSIQSEQKEVKAKFGLYRSLIANMVKGVSDGFNTDLELVGIGYRVQLNGQNLMFTLGYSHEVNFPAPVGIKFVVETNTKFRVSGIDKQLVGQVVANIRKLRRPDAYKGKGIRLAGTKVALKAGKSVKK